MAIGMLQLEFRHWKILIDGLGLVLSSDIKAQSTKLDFLRMRNMLRLLPRISLRM